MNFNGTSDYVDLNNPFESVFQDSFTISAWIYDTHAASDYQTIYFATTELYLSVEGDDGDIHVGVGGNGEKFYTSYDDETLAADAPIKKNRWHHVAVTYSGGTDGTGKIYVDGVSQAVTLMLTYIMLQLLLLK